MRSTWKAGDTMTTNYDLSKISLYGLSKVVEAAHYLGDSQLETQAVAEIDRRLPLPSPTTHDVPEGFAWLPRAFWHTKPVGEGTRSGGGVVVNADRIWRLVFALGVVGIFACMVLWLIFQSFLWR
jgi:hypothetical protein